MLRSLIVVSTLFALGWSTAQAEENPLDFFRPDVAVVAKIESPDRSIEKIVALANQLQPGTGASVEQPIKSSLGQSISNPKLIGADLSQDWYLGVYADGKSMPTVVFAIPAVDTDDFVAAVGDGMTTAIEGNYVLYTDSEDLIQPAEGAETFSKSFTDAPQESLAAGTVSIHMNSKLLVRAYKDQIETGYQQLLDGISELQFNPQVGEMNLAQVFEMYKVLAQKLYQGLKDSSSLTVSATISENGLSIDELVLFNNNSKTSRKLAEFETSEIPNLSKLPKDALAYYGLSGGLSEFMRWSMKFSAGMVNDANSRKRIEGAMEDFAKLEHGTIAASFSAGETENGLFQGVTIWEANPIEDAKKIMRASASAMGDIKMAGLTQSTVIEEDAETYGDVKVDVMTVTQEFDEDLPGADMQNQMRQLMFGPEGMQSRIAYRDGQIVTVLGGPKMAEAFFTNSGSESSNDLSEIRSHLIQDVNFIGLFDGPRLAGEMLSAFSKVDGFPVQIDEQMVANLALKTSYTGISVGTRENALHCKTEIPVEQMKGVAKLAMFFVALQMQQQQQQF